MNGLPRIWIDWNDCSNDAGVQPLNLPYTLEHFEKLGLPITEGLKIRLFGDDVEADAVVVRDSNGHWGAKIVDGTLINVDLPTEDSH